MIEDSRIPNMIVVSRLSVNSLMTLLCSLQRIGANKKAMNGVKNRFSQMLTI